MDALTAVGSEIEVLYDTVGFDQLLTTLDAMLIHRWNTQHRLEKSRSAHLEREIARLKKARLPLSDTERDEIRERGILWSPQGTEG